MNPLRSTAVCLLCLTAGACAAPGDAEPGFNPVSGGQVLGAVTQADGKILICGGFEFAGGVPRRWITRLHSEGTLDTGFAPIVSDDVWTMSVQTDGKIVIGGYFSKVDGVTRNRVARLNPDGTLDADFNPNVVGQVYSSTVQTDGIQIFLTPPHCPRGNCPMTTTP